MFIGHPKIVAYLENLIRNNLIFKNYLFLGPCGLGKSLLALNFAKTLLCQKLKSRLNDECECSSCHMISLSVHPDFINLKSEEGKEISINQIREVKRLLLYKPIGRRIVLIDDAELLNPHASDSLLKILEEVNHQTIFIFISNKILKPTITSRLEIIKFRALTDDELLKAVNLLAPKAKNDFKEMVIYFSAGTTSRLLTFINFPDLIKIYSELASEFMAFLMGSIRERFNYLEKYLDEKKDKRLKIINQADFLMELWLKILSDFIIFSFSNPINLPEKIKNEFSKIKDHNLKITDLTESLLNLKRLNFLFNLNERFLLEQLAIV